MFEKVKFVMDYDTVLFLPKYDEFGHLKTIVMQDGHPVKVDMSPTELIDFNLRYFGSSLRGAGDGTRMILGEISMYPIVISEKLDLYWFPSKSPSCPSCVWFALHHIEGYKRVGKKQTKVFLSDNSTVVIDSSVYSFEKKIQRTYALKYKIEGRSHKSIMKVREVKQSYHITKVVTSRNYELIIKKL